ncbi:8761_t:CDS:2 [Ambispora gerdemannii]|uniref:NEDD8-activating enzyme E1 catalytic subunit n=1 Tax=Ambispora gerdemannii TaxID=144530 RepID=A0A9N9CVX8_9GLOM|nr:8761_t:CDS:2 [Ambispora gerdemannii]
MATQMQTDTPTSFQDSISSNIDWSNRWTHINKVLNRRGPFCDESFAPGQGKNSLDTCKILVIGAGGLGCEILKNLALSGFKNIHVIDMDTIDVSNLNRQFLFRPSDVGRPKAIVAAEFVMKRVAGVTVTPYHGKIQDKDADYYSQFQIVICGLDSVEARRWMNATIVEISRENEEVIPLIDGGTEGFKGQARVIIPTLTSCYECSLDMLNKPTTFPICTIANTPRLPEHCIEWAYVLEWPKAFPEQKLDTDEPQHIQWVYETANTRAKQFNITGVTYTLTQGVVKNIIPAIASTNAIVAAACCNEAFKLATTTAPYLNNYMMYTGNEGIYTYTFEHQKKPECPVCSDENNPVSVEVKKNMTLEEFIDWLKEKPDAQLKKPSLSTASKKLYLQAPPFLEKSTRPNLEKKLRDLVEEGEEIVITDTTLPFSLRLLVNYL